MATRLANGAIVFKQTKRHSELEEINRGFLINISDTGIGIKEEHLDQIIDSFFTTKGEVKGVGMGLSFCYGFITEHGGDIEVKNRVGEGTTFTILLPVYKAPESRQEVASD